MGDYFYSPEGTPLPPPEPDTPPPDFETLGKNLGLGIAKSGTFAAFIAQFMDQLFALFTKLVGALINFVAGIFVFFMGQVEHVSENARTGIGLLTAATLKSLTGIDVAPGDVDGGPPGAGRQAAANKMGQAIVGTMFAGAQPQDGGGVVPSANSADSFLAMVMRLELNGWLESWVSDGLSAHFLEKYGDLKDGLSRSLGFGRLARQVFRAPLKVLVSDPYTALLHQKYRPRPWDVDALMAQLNRGQITRAQLSDPLGNQGYTEAQIDELVRKNQKNLSLGEIDYLDQRGMAPADSINGFLQALGYNEGTADTIVSILRDKRVQKYRMEMVSVGETAYVAGKLDLGPFQAIVQQCGLSADEQNWILQVAQLKRTVNVRHLTEGEIIKGIEEGILSFNDLKAWAVRENMPIEEEAYLELETQFAANKASALAKAKQATAAAKVQAANAKLATAQAKAAAASTTAATTGLTPAQAATLVKDHIWTMAQYTAFLTSRGFGPDAVQANVALIQAEVNATAAKTAAAGAVRSSAAAKGLNLAQMEKAVIEGITTEDKLQSFLSSNGYSADDAQIIVDLTHNALTAAQAKADAKQAATAHATTKSISLPDLERAVRLGLTSIDSYTAALRKAQFDEGSIALLSGILQAQMVKDKATAVKSAAAASTAVSKGITIGQLQAEVLAGVRPIGDYTLALSAAGYSADDQIDLTQLLQLKLDQATSAAEKRDAAAAALAKRGISLSAAERAVKLGIVPISVYQSMLQSLHYTQDAIDVLSNTLLAEMAATRKAQASANTAAGVLAAKSISLPDLERAVVAGITPIDSYTAALTGAGYAAADVDTLTQLVQLKVDQAAAAAAKHADAEGVATQQGISLGSEEKAVVAGIKGMDDYDALLFALGYDDVDRATLEALLQAKVDAAAAKAAG